MTQPRAAPGRSGDETGESNADGDPSDLIEVFNDYLDRGDYPPRDLLDRSPDHQLTLDALVRFRRVTGALLADDIAAAARREDGWVATILANIHSEARAGRSIPLAHPSSIADLSISEGAVRGLVRAAGDAVSGTLIGACRLEGDVTEPGAPITVAVQASVFWGERIRATAEHIRTAIESTLLLHTELNIVAVDVTVTDVHLRRTAQESS